MKKLKKKTNKNDKLVNLYWGEGCGINFSCY